MQNQVDFCTLRRCLSITTLASYHIRAHVDLLWNWMNRSMVWTNHRMICLLTEKWDSHKVEAEMKFSAMFQGCLTHDAR